MRLKITRVRIEQMKKYSRTNGKRTLDITINKAIEPSVVNQG